MLALVEGGMEYLNTLATVFDEAARKRMTKLFKEAQRELKGRLVVEGGHTHHHGDGAFHHHGDDAPGHRHGAPPDSNVHRPACRAVLPHPATLIFQKS